MKLHDYLKDCGISDAEFGSLVEASEDAVRKWKYGQRMPRPQVLARIREVTNGAVTANDFLPAPEPVA